MGRSAMAGDLKKRGGGQGLFCLWSKEVEKES